jgi:phage/plasmid-like protein (TIGR03299 family)
MSAEVETMMYAYQTPWHGLGKRLPAEVTAAEAIKHAGLDWLVRKVPMITADNKNVVPDFYAAQRESDGRVLGVIGERYKHIQNINAFNFFDGVVGSGQAIYHTAGSLQGGKRIWILAKLPGDIVVGKDDVTEKYLLLSNSHDGSSPLFAFFTPIRVVCQNTLNAALQAKDGKGISIRHTSSVEERMKEAEKILSAAHQHYDVFGELAKHLASRQFNTSQLKSLVQELFPAKDDGETTKKTVEKQEQVIYLFDHGKGHDAIKGSAWAALNAVAEYADHNMTMRNPDADKRTFNAWFGGAALLKQRAQDLIVQMAA